MTALDVALEYCRRGWAPLPIPQRKKRPVLREWEKLRITAAEAPRYFNGAKMNIGVLLGTVSGDLVDIDLDCPEAVSLAPYFLPKTGAIFGRKGKPRSHWLYQAALKTAKFVEPGTNTMLVELRSTGGQTVFPGSVHESGEEVEWVELGDPAEVHPTMLRQSVARLAAATLLARHWPAEGGRHDGALTVVALLIRAGWTPEDVARFVVRVSWAAGAEPDYGKRRATAEDAVRRLAGGEELRGAPAFEELFGAKVARAATRWLDVETRPAEAKAKSPGEDQLARNFTARHGHELRYVAPWGQWLRWTRARWEHEPTLLAFDLARRICREAEAADAKTVAAVVTLARADRKHAATTDQWDNDPWRLNTPGGVVDLRTGKLDAHDPAAYHTKITAAPPQRADCPLWLAFLERVTAGDRELQDFLQRMAGYALTGSIREHALFFLYGSGANGKGVFLNTLTGLLGDYAAVAPMETFTASQADQHPTDRAMLRGARLVAAQETEQGRRWAESRIKAMTGGDPIPARFMRQDFFTFVPQFKLVIAGNHKPGLRNVDEAIRRRLHLVPFTVTIPPADRDPDLPEKLRAEWPGILSWAIDGCLQWQRTGLAPPACVRAATEEYFGSEDAVQVWLDERCVRHPNAVTSSAELFDDWKAWAERASEFVGSRKRFGQALEARGFKPCKNTRDQRAFRGIGLKEPPRQVGDEADPPTHSTHRPIIDVPRARTHAHTHERPIYDDASNASEDPLEDPKDDGVACPRCRDQGCRWCEREGLA